MATKKFKRTFAKKGKKSMRSKRVAKKPTQSMKRFVKAEIARNIENKCGQDYDLGKPIFASSSANFNSSVFPLSPASTGSISIVQGTGQGNRVGNKIKIKKATLKGTLHPNAYNATPGTGYNPQPIPIQVIMWFFYDKENPNSIPAPASDFFQFGGTTSAMQNDLVDLWAPINTDKYRVFGKRMFKLGHSEWATTGSAPTLGNSTNNDFKYNCNFSVNVAKWMPKMYTFRDNNADPSTRGLYCMVQCIAASGGQIADGQWPATMSYMLDLEWEDA